MKRRFRDRLWTEQSRNEKIFDELMYPNLIVLVQRH